MNESRATQTMSDFLEEVEQGQELTAASAGNAGAMAGEDVIELGDSFDMDGFQVVRREFFAHTNEPSVSFNNCKFYVNSACLAKLPETDYVQVLINPDTHILALRPCEERDRESLAWCGSYKGKRKPRQTTCKLFFAKVVSMMDWNPDYRYKLMGKLIHAKGEYLLAFDLTATEVYQRTFPERAKPKTSRTPIFPSSWQNQFGLPFEEHRQSMQINIFDGYAIYSLKDNIPADSDGTSVVSDLVAPLPSVTSEGGAN